MADLDAPRRRRPDADADTSPEERAAMLLLAAHLLSEHRTYGVITDEALERAHRAKIYPYRIESTLYVDVEER